MKIYWDAKSAPVEQELDLRSATLQNLTITIRDAHDNILEVLKTSAVGGTGVPPNGDDYHFVIHLKTVGK